MNAKCQLNGKCTQREQLRQSLWCFRVVKARSRLRFMIVVYYYMSALFHAKYTCFTPISPCFVHNEFIWCALWSWFWAMKLQNAIFSSSVALKLIYVVCVLFVLDFLIQFHSKCHVNFKYIILFASFNGRLAHTHWHTHTHTQQRITKHQALARECTHTHTKPQARTPFPSFAYVDMRIFVVQYFLLWRESKCVIPYLV